MASSPSSRGSSDAKPGSIHSTKSFPRQDPAEDTDSLKPPKRASTFQYGVVPEVTVASGEPPDAFENESDDDPAGPPRTSVDMDDMPIELVSLIDNFIDSLSAKVHSSPPNIDRLSGMFQDFYQTTSTHIQTHIASIASRQSRGGSGRPPPSPRTVSATSLLRAKAASLGGKEKAKPNTVTEADQQMLTPEELNKRKRARKALEQKRVTLEEAVERRLCEGIYERIYRHRSTQDEANDDKLRSKTAALGLVGVGPADLGVDLGLPSTDDPEAASRKHEELRQYLDQARNDLITMNVKRYPLGKLHSLKAAHKSIVDTLSHFHPSSSADEIMPMLIYTLITMPPEKLNVISDSNFIQRFRWEERLEGEAAYCLTNLEAAITFLETVDLTSLRGGEIASDSAKLGDAPETFPPAYTANLSSSVSERDHAENPSSERPAPSLPDAKTALQRRRLSDLIHTPAQAIGTASDSIFNTADQGFKTIGTSLGDSYKFLLGKFRDASADGRDLVIPRTLDDARKLIGTPPPEDDVSVDGSIDAERNAKSREDKLLALVGGKKPSARDHSADSSRSGRSAGSSKKVLFAEDGKEKAPGPSNAQLGTSGGAGGNANSNPALVESMRNLGSSLNPMNRFAGMTMMRGFGRPNQAATSSASATPKDLGSKNVEGGDLGTAFPDIAAALPPKNTPKVQGPIKKFMDLENPGDLRLGEVLELLRDYRRLAQTLKELEAFQD